MAISGFELPRVTLEQSYAAAAPATTSTLAVACIGPRYALHRADHAGEAALVPNSSSYSPTTGLPSVNYTLDGAGSTAIFPGHVVGGVPDLVNTSTQHLVIKDGVWTYASIASGSSNYTVNGSVITFVSLIVANGNGNTCSSDFVTRGVRVGDPIILKSATTAVVATVLAVSCSVSGGAYDQIVLSSSYAGALADATSILFCEYDDVTLEYDSGKFGITESSGTYNITISGAITTGLEDLGGKTGTLQTADFYLEYRERFGKGKNELGTLSSLSDIEEELGGVSRDNPLALACYFAMAGGGGNSVVYYTVVTEDTSVAYVAACDFLSKFNMLYSIVPCTSDEAIIQQCMASCIGYSNDPNSKIRRALWYGIDLPETLTIWNGTGGTNSTASTTITLDDDVFIDYPLQAGDKLVYNSTEYAILSTNGVNTAVIGTSLTIANESPMAIQRTKPTNANLIETLVQLRKARSTSERGMCVWADGIKFDGATVPNYAGAAAAAGMRASEPCQRPLSNLGYSFFTLNETHGFSLGELTRIGSEGIWMIGSNSDGLPVNLRQITTAVANNLLLDEESIISNADTIAINLSHMGEEYVGNSNITPELLDVLRTMLGAYLEECTINYTGNIFIGPQLLGWDVVRLWQDPVNRDHVYADVEVEPPRPFNRFHIMMRVI